MVIEFLEGNEAIARGAMRAQCDFFAGYPITPASSILHYLMEWLPRQGGIAIQAEDEIASIGLCIGAAMAGRRALTATSGPGISLYSENIGLAIIGETPLVIVDVQRQGPGTGSATKGADSDVMFVRWGTSGGLPIVALCPASVADCYELTYRAFNIAEELRVPVFVLSNKEIGLTRERVDLDAVPLPPLVERTAVRAEGEFHPHGFAAPEETPPMSPFGGPHVLRYTTSTHDQEAYLTTDPAVIGRMVEHYAAKVERHADRLALVERDLQAGADTLVVSYGVTSRAATEAVREARVAGRPVSSLVLRTLWPVPEQAIREAMTDVRRVVVPEMNLGQYVLEIQRLAAAEVQVVPVSRMDTTLLSPAEIAQRGGLR